MTELWLNIYVLTAVGVIWHWRATAFRRPWYYPVVVTLLLGNMALGACFVVVLVLDSLRLSGPLFYHWVAWLLV
jgi:hypothetical protein